MKDDYTIQILTTSLIHFSLKGWENVLPEVVSERVVSAAHGLLHVIAAVTLELKKRAKQTKSVYIARTAVT